MPARQSRSVMTCIACLCGKPVGSMVIGTVADKVAGDARGRVVMEAAPAAAFIAAKPEFLLEFETVAPDQRKNLGEQGPIRPVGLGHEMVEGLMRRTHAARIDRCRRRFDALALQRRQRPGRTMPKRRVTVQMARRRRLISAKDSGRAPPRKHRRDRPLFVDKWRFAATIRPSAVGSAIRARFFASFPADSDK